MIAVTKFWINQTNKVNGVTERVTSITNVNAIVIFDEEDGIDSKATAVAASAVHADIGHATA